MSILCSSGVECVICILCSKFQDRVAGCPQYLTNAVASSQLTNPHAFDNSFHRQAADLHIPVPFQFMLGNNIIY